MKDRKDQEASLKEALAQIEGYEGVNSIIAGHILLELFDLYEEQGREDEAKAIWERLRRVLVASIPTRP